MAQPRGAKFWKRVCRGHSPPATVRGPVLRPPRAVGMLSVVTAFTRAGLRGGGSGSPARSWPPGSSAAV